jgi:hypothetical protein
MAFISVCARISVWASLPTDASSFWLSVGAARALSTKVRMCVMADWLPARHRACRLLIVHANGIGGHFAVNGVRFVS